MLWDMNYVVLKGEECTKGANELCYAEWARTEMYQSRIYFQ